jgi:hypothetical protein
VQRAALLALELAERLALVRPVPEQELQQRELPARLPELQAQQVQQV